MHHCVPATLLLLQNHFLYLKAEGFLCFLLTSVYSKSSHISLPDSSHYWPLLDTSVTPDNKPLVKTKCMGTYSTLLPLPLQDLVALCWSASSNHLWKVHTSLTENCNILTSDFPFQKLSPVAVARADNLADKVQNTPPKQGPIQSFQRELG